MALQPKSNLTPLPLGVTPEAASPSAAEPVDPVEQWMEQPEFKAQDAPPQPPAPQTEQPPEVAPEATPETAAQPPEAEPADKAPSAAPEVKPTDQPPAKPAEVPVTAEVPTPPTPRTYAPDETFALAEGVEWKRDQIVRGLQQRAEILPEYEKYRATFGMSAAEAEAQWKPILTRLQQEPHTVAFLNAFFTNAEKADYLQRCSHHYDAQVQPQAQTPSAPAQPVPNEKLSVVERELAELKEFRLKQERESATQRINTEIAQATSRYPFLATDSAAMQDLILTAKALNEQDASKGIVDALALKAPMYQAMEIARKAQAPAPTPQPDPSPQPALIGSSGASPNGSRPTSNGRPKKFDSPDDAVADWIDNPPPDLK